MNVRDDIKSLLIETLDIHTILNQLKDKPGDLDIIKKQVEKIEELFETVCKKIEKLDNSSDDYVILVKAIKFYLENYDFYTVIDSYMMYDQDSARVKNMRILVITALEDKKLIEKIQKVIEV